VPRGGITVREAHARDAEALLDLWADLFRSATPERVGAPSLSDAQDSLIRSVAEPDRRVVVAETSVGHTAGGANGHAGAVVGVALLRRLPITPLHVEETVHLSHMQVHPDFRRHGVGRALVAAAAAWAEDTSAEMVVASVSATDREANRFLARLGLAQLATLRGGTVKALRARLPAEAPAVALVDARTQRSVGQVVARRRSQRLGLSRSGRPG
jgi:GNAT superfamily N-acetyltransferase